MVPDAVVGVPDRSLRAAGGRTRQRDGAITAVPGLARQVLADHVDAGTGPCRHSAIGAQAGQHRWPCRVHTYPVALLQWPLMRLDATLAC